MSFFSHGEDRDRLAILYFMKQVGCELTREQLYRVMAVNDWMNYFDFQTALLRLAEDGYLTTFERTFGQGYMLSSEGFHILELFEKQLPHSYREAMKSYCEANRERLRRETQYSATCKRRKDGSSWVELKALDGDSVVLEMNFSAPTHELAQKAAERWPMCAQEIFREALEKLYE